MKNRPKVLGTADAARLLGISHQRFGKLARDYEIPHQTISCGKVFFEQDILDFKNSEERKENMKYLKKGMKK